MKKYALPIAFSLAASFILAASCVTTKPTPQASATIGEADAIKVGARLFDEGNITEAAKTWAKIPDPDKRTLYVSYAEAYSAFDAAVAKAEKALLNAEPEAALAAAKDSGTLPAAPPTVTSADPRDARSRLARVGEHAGSILAARAAKTESATDIDPASARSGEAKAQSAEELREALLSFSERMGEVFARTPSSSDKLDDRILLAFNAETAAMISGSLSDFDRIVAKNPGILDSATVDRLRDSARGLFARFARIEAVVKTVKDRGKPVMPIIIGIFNPEPHDPQRSRPATFAGDSRTGSDSEWWWGIADIPKGLAQDLVVSMSDSRPIRIYAVGLGTGGKKPASDLVNPLFRVGNSWPVLNAGARLDDGVFHIEVGPGRSEAYSGEAVVYKSFMMRTR